MATKKGKASTYGNYPGGFVDRGDNNRPALAGASNNNPGIAVFNRRTLGGWWEVKSPNGKTAVVQQTDIGPAPRTGRLVDINSKAAKDVFGLKVGNAFPTDQGRWALRYLGKKPPKGGGLASKVKERASKGQAAPAVGAGGLDTSSLGQSSPDVPQLASAQSAMPPITLPGSPAHSARRFLRSATGQTEVQTQGWQPPEPAQSSGISAQLQDLQARTEATPFVGPAKRADLGTVDPNSTVPMPKGVAREPSTGGGGPVGRRSSRLPGGVVTYGKGWGGSEGVLDLARKTARDIGAPITSEKRSSNSVSGGMSDHWTGNKKAYALDIAATGATGDRIAASLKRRYGLKGPVVGTFGRQTVKVGNRPYSIQVLWKVEGHYDHVHVGVRAL